MEKSSSSSVSEETAPDSDRADTDCDKHIKALINMQIKENRYTFVFFFVTISFDS